MAVCIINACVFMCIGRSVRRVIYLWERERERESEWVSEWMCVYDCVCVYMLMCLCMSICLGACVCTFDVCVYGCLGVCAGKYVWTYIMHVCVSACWRTCLCTLYISCTHPWKWLLLQVIEERKGPIGASTTDTNITKQQPDTARY